jgi:hypothetical protein
MDLLTTADIRAIGELVNQAEANPGAVDIPFLDQLLGHLQTIRELYPPVNEAIDALLSYRHTLLKHAS